MRFTLYTRTILALVSAVSAIPSGITSSSYNDYAVRGTAQEVFAGGDHTGAQEDRDATWLSLEARMAKFKESKISLTISKTLEAGRISQGQLEDTTTLAKCAMFEAGVTHGEVIYGWHGAGTNTKDPVDHVTIKPTEGPGAAEGNMHVHRDGSWTQGPGGKVEGTGKSCYT